MSDQHLISEHFRQFDSHQDDQKQWYLRGVFASTRPNANGRTYPREVLEAAIATYVDQHVRNRTSYGALDHPDNAQVNLASAAVLITSLEWIGDEVWGEATVLSTKQGTELQRILEAGGSVGMSTRGHGTQGRDGTISEYKLIGIDVVARASAHSARQVEAIYENEELEEQSATVNFDRETISSRLRRIKLRKRHGVNTNPRLKNDDGQSHSPSARTHNPSNRGRQNMQREDFKATDGKRYLSPDSKLAPSTKKKSKYLKPKGAKISLESELVENLMQVISEHHQDGPVFDAMLTLGEHYMAECNTSKMPKNTIKSTPTHTQNNLSHSNTPSGAASAVMRGAKAINKAHTKGVKADELKRKAAAEMKREAVETEVWRLTFGGGACARRNKETN